jgi:ADP-heptose:LPS heptosyltransferase
MKILAIRFARLGDVILLLPALSQLKKAFPASHVTFLTGHRCAPVAELCPAIDDVISLDRIALRDGPMLTAIGEMARLVRDIRRRRVDLVVDFHGFRETNLLTWFSGAPKRVALKRYKAPYLSFCFNLPPIVEDKSVHVSEMFRRVVAGITANQPGALERSLVIPRPIQEWALQAMPHGPRVALYVDAPVPERIWPSEYFAKVADLAIERLHAGVAVISGPEGRRLTEEVRKSSRYGQQLSLFSDLTVHELAGLIASCRLLVSNDTGPMHIGPAVGVPTIGLFSVGYPEHFAPTGPSDKVFRANPIEGIEVDKVIETIEQMWITTVAGPDFRR